MFKLKFFFITFALYCLMLFTGCYYGSFSIKSAPETSLKPCPVKFYIVSIETQYSVDGQKGTQKLSVVQETDLIKQALVSNYPDFFVDDKSKGVNVNFYWNIDYHNFTNGGMFLVSAVSIGIIPSVHFVDYTGTLAASRKDISSLSDDAEVLKKGLKYPVKSTLVYYGPFFASVSGALASLFVPGEDVTCFVDEAEVHRPPFNFCEANLRLFPAACIKFYNDLTYKEKQELDDIYNPKDIIFLTE